MNITLCRTQFTIISIFHFQIESNSEFGRYMVATRDFKAGDVIFRDDPIVLGPKQISEPVCLGCYRRVDGSYRYTNLLLTVKYHFYNSVTSITNLLNLRSIERDLNITIWSTIKKKISWNDRD